MRGTDGITWTDARLSRLRALWAAGVSSGQIAVDLDITRNAVVGKITRLKLPPPDTKMSTRQSSRGREPATASPAPPKLPGKIASISRSFSATLSAKPHNGSFSAVNAMRRVERLEASPGLPECVNDEAPSYRGIQLLDLDDDTCRWPIGTPGTEGFCFCGNMPVNGLPYCAGHCRLAYESPRARTSADRRALHRADTES